MRIDSKYHYLTGTHCWYCRREYSTSKCIYNGPGRPLEKTKDHIIPLANNGINSPKNYISCCIDCNSLKAHRTLLQFISYLEQIQFSVYERGHSMSKYLKLIINNSWKLYNKVSIKQSLK